MNNPKEGEMVYLKGDSTPMLVGKVEDTQKVVICFWRDDKTGDVKQCVLPFCVLTDRF